MAPSISMSTLSTQRYTDIHRPSLGSEEKVTPAASIHVGRGDAEDGAAAIPFRTSKRLQGVIYRMIQESAPSTKKVKQSSPSSTPSSSSRPLKRQLSPPVRMRFDLNQPVPESIEMDEICVLDDEVLSRKKKKTKHSAVHFADPLCVVIADEKKVTPGSERSSPTNSTMQVELPESKDIVQAQAQTKPSPNLKTKISTKSTRSSPGKSNHQPKPRPLSCFDLLCNHIGPRGWRCYRTSVEDRSFCSYHDNQTPAAPSSAFDSGMSLTICT